MRDFIVWLSGIDRRWVFLSVAVFTVAPFLIPGGLGLPKPKVTRYTELVFDEVENCGPETKPILLSMDYDPGTLAELQPMAEAILRHIFSRRAKVIVVTFMPTGAGLAQETVYRVAGEFPVHPGDEFVCSHRSTPLGAVEERSFNPWHRLPPRRSIDAANDELSSQFGVSMLRGRPVLRPPRGTGILQRRAGRARLEPGA